MKNRSVRLGLMFVFSAAAMAVPGVAHAQTEVTPAPPVFKDACGTDRDSYVIPYTAGVDYYVGGVKVNPGVRQVDPSNPRVEVFTNAQPGYTLSERATWSITFDAERGCDGEVYVQTGNEPPAETTPAPTEQPTEQVETVIREETVVETTMQTTPTDELPATGFATDAVMMLGAGAFAGAVALGAVRRHSGRSQTGQHIA